MASIADFHSEGAVDDRQLTGLTGWVARWIARLCGAVLLIAAVGLWVAPGTAFEADVLLIKTGLTAFLCFTGIPLLRFAARR